jgi:hypothetical protein
MRPIDEDDRFEVEMIAFAHLVTVGDVLRIAKRENPISELHICDQIRAELEESGIEFVAERVADE